MSQKDTFQTLEPKVSEYNNFQDLTKEISVMFKKVSLVTALGKTNFALPLFDFVDQARFQNFLGLNPHFLLLSHDERSKLQKLANESNNGISKFLASTSLSYKIYNSIMAYVKSKLTNEANTYVTNVLSPLYAQLEEKYNAVNVDEFVQIVSAAIDIKTSNFKAYVNQVNTEIADKLQQLTDLEVKITKANLKNDETLSKIKELQDKQTDILDKLNTKYENVSTISDYMNTLMFRDKRTDIINDYFGSYRLQASEFSMSKSSTSNTINQFNVWTFTMFGGPNPNINTTSKFLSAVNTSQINSFKRMAVIAVRASDIYGIVKEVFPMVFKNLEGIPIPNDLTSNFKFYKGKTFNVPIYGIYNLSIDVSKYKNIKHDKNTVFTSRFYTPTTFPWQHLNQLASQHLDMHSLCTEYANYSDSTVDSTGEQRNKVNYLKVQNFIREKFFSKIPVYSESGAIINPSPESLLMASQSFNDPSKSKKIQLAFTHESNEFLKAIKLVNSLIRSSSLLNAPSSFGNSMGTKYITNNVYDPTMDEPKITPFIFPFFGLSAVLKDANGNWNNSSEWLQPAFLPLKQDNYGSIRPRDLFDLFYILPITYIVDKGSI